MYRLFLKRSLDFFIALIALLVLSPALLFLCIALASANQGAGVFFTQTRTGKGAKLFSVLKFKTMTDQRDSLGKLLLDRERITHLGSFMRATSLDELPQLVNVLKGEMSLIGPRPLLKKYIPLYSKEQLRRHEVKPGITGWAQVNGRNNISWKQKFKYDVYYVDNLSLSLDLKIIVYTIQKVLGRSDITTEDPEQFQPFNGNN
ncbi:sugar transferase [Akkermansiaceae bacterium]|nr:sugar transferase [Akkermansiaceae bacterium]